MVMLVKKVTKVKKTTKKSKKVKTVKKLHPLYKFRNYLQDLWVTSMLTLPQWVPVVLLSGFLIIVWLFYL